MYPPELPPRRDTMHAPEASSNEELVVVEGVKHVEPLG
jgi:hypothetical protein